MRNSDLAEIRALLKAQAEAEVVPPRPGLFRGGKTKLRSAPRKKAGPLNLSPLEPTELELAPSLKFEERPSTDGPPEPYTDAALSSADAPAPLLFLAPKRSRFGLADDAPRPAPEPVVHLQSLFDEEDYSPRRRGQSIAAAEASGVGADEILELQELLSERMPHMLDGIDLESKLARAVAPSPPVPTADEPSIEFVVAAVEAARAQVERAAAMEAWAQASAALRAKRVAAAQGRARLAGVLAEMSAEHAVVEGDLEAVRRGRAGRFARAA